MQPVNMIDYHSGNPNFIAHPVCFTQGNKALKKVTEKIVAVENILSEKEWAPHHESERAFEKLQNEIDNWKQVTDALAIKF